MRGHVLNRNPVLVWGVVLLFASVGAAQANNDGHRSEKEMTAGDLTERFSLIEPGAPDSYPFLDLFGKRVIDSSAYLEPVRFESGLVGTRGQAADDTTTRRRTRLSSELGIGYAAFTTKGIGGGIRYGMAFMGKVSPRIGIEFILERLRAPVDGDVDPFKLGAGTLYVTPLSVNVQYRWREKGRFTPYALLGVGFNFYHFLPEEGHEEVADRLALILGGGVDTRIGQNTSLHLGLKFAPVPTWVQEKGSHPEPDDQEKIWLNPFTFTLGIKYFFD
ncbi:MAG: hypothetical protein ACERK6_00975 [Candidatus Aminicenantaceae bacterium]